MALTVTARTGLHARSGSLSRTKRVVVAATHRTPAFLGAPVVPRCPPSARAARAARPRHSASSGGARRGAVLRPAAAARAPAVGVQANLFSRLVRVVRAYVSNFTEQFEDPEVLLDRVTDEMQEDLLRMRQATAKVMASEKQMAAKFAAAQATSDEWLRRAELAVRKGQDELAREALLRRKTFDTAANSLKVQLDAQRRALEQLQGNVRLLESKLGEARNKRETLKARAASAKSSKQIQEMVAGLRINNSTAWAAFDKMEEKVMAMEAEAESTGLLAAPDNVEAAFARLEGSGTVDEELAALKRGALAAASSTPAPGSLGRPLAEVLVRTRDTVRALEGVDAELEQLRKRARGQ